MHSISISTTSVMHDDGMMIIIRYFVECILQYIMVILILIVERCVNQNRVLTEHRSRRLY